MRTKIILATSNEHKKKEVQSIVGDEYEVLSLRDMHCNLEADEPYDTLRENAQAKADFYYELFDTPTLAEDSGLFVESLNGDPGVKSARYAQVQNSDLGNNDLLLENLKNETNRRAYFESVLAYRVNTEEIYFFDGKMNGKIALEAYGKGGFGYDPVFIADGKQVTNAELSMEEKNEISHRRQAVDKFVKWLDQNKTSN